MQKAKKQLWYEVILKRLQSHIKACSEHVETEDTTAQSRLAALMPLILEDVAILSEAKLVRSQSIKIGKALEATCRDLKETDFKAGLERMLDEAGSELMEVSDEEA